LVLQLIGKTYFDCAKEIENDFVKYMVEKVYELNFVLKDLSQFLDN